MKKRLILFFISLMFIPHIIYSWDSTAAKFYPLAVGNLWSYNYKSYQNPLGCSIAANQYNYIVRITLDTLMPNGKRYYKLTGGGTYYHRIDSASMNVYQFGQGNSECLVDSLLARMNNSYITCNNFPRSVVDTNLVLFAGQMRRTKQIAVFAGNRRLMEGMGLYNDYYCELGSGYNKTLNGCIINGIQYGEILGVEPISNEIPADFKLEQNYPNPFNPTTKIRFSVPLYKGGERGIHAKLSVFDILGREIQILVNEALKPGKYEIEWDASAYSSGIYFYRFLTNEFSEIKKMILIK